MLTDTGFVVDLGYLIDAMRLRQRAARCVVIGKRGNG